MRRMRRAIAERLERSRNESGATIVFIAVVLLALLAMTAFVIDFGRIWQERRELQVGATAGALAVGEDCARDLCVGGYNELITAEAYADANAGDGAASVYSIDLDLSEQTVHVVTATENTAGGDTLDMLFARIVGFDTITVGADAKVAWGTPLENWTLPLIFSDCEWRNDAPGWPDANSNLPEAADIVPGEMVVITFHDPMDPDAQCDAHPGFDADGDGKLPAGFGWLDTTSGCESLVEEGAVIGSDPGSSPSTGCSASYFEDLLGETVYIPYYSDVNGVSGSGNVGSYTIVASGAFLVSGYNFGGQYRDYDPMLTKQLPCTGSVRCLGGWFVKSVTHSGGPGGLGGTDRGVTVIKLIG